MKKMPMIVCVALVVLITGLFVRFGWVQGQEKTPPNSRLAVIWTSGDPEVAYRVCFMYTDNAKKQKWFDEVTLIV